MSKQASFRDGVEFSRVPGTDTLRSSGACGTSGARPWNSDGSNDEAVVAVGIWRGPAPRISQEPLISGNGKRLF
jgi:hypothetical protein